MEIFRRRMAEPPTPPPGHANKNRIADPTEAEDSVRALRRIDMQGLDGVSWSPQHRYSRSASRSP